MTVSYTYNQPARVSASSRAKVLAAAQKLDYAGPHRAARALRTGRSAQIGVVFGETLPFAFYDQQATEFLAGIAEVCAEKEMGMSIIPTSGPHARAMITQSDVAGYILWATSEDDPTLDILVETERPVVVLGGPARPGWGLVAFDNRAAGRAIADLVLVDAEHPAVISQPGTHARPTGLQYGPDLDQITHTITRARLHGLKEAINQRGMSWSSVPVYFLPWNSRRETAKAAESLLLAHPETDAVYALTDQIGTATLRALRTRGIDVPGEVAVTGFEDGHEAEAMGLTTVGQSPTEQGRYSARMLLEMDAGGDPAFVETDWKIVERDSHRRRLA